MADITKTYAEATMKISIFGLGYVGAVSAACLAQEGHRVIGVDTESKKVDMINQGISPIIESGLGEIIKSEVEKGRLTATTQASEAIYNSRISLICVGTPSHTNGNLNTNHVRRVCQDIGSILKNKTDHHVVVIRSTILPGTVKNIVIPTLEEASGKRAGEDFGVCNNPEFLREGSAVHDYFNPPKTIIGQTDEKSGDLLADIYGQMDAPIIRTEIEIAEMVKYVDNTWHALKVAFGNEIGTLCKSMKIDSHKVMDIFCQDTKLNISPNYLTPGFAFGGSCLPKDIRALAYKGKILDIHLPVLNAILPSNESHIKNGLQIVMDAGHRDIGILGFSFKAGTDDLRESPVVELIERLLGKGYNIKIYDRNVNLAALIGANREFILNKIPHIAKLMVQTREEVIQHAKTIVIGTNSREFHHLKLDKNHTLVDLVRAIPNRASDNHYKGICW